MRKLMARLGFFTLGVVLPLLLIQAMTTQKVFGQDIGLIRGEVRKELRARGLIDASGAPTSQVSYPIAVDKGGSGTASAPTYGQLLIGNASGGYTIATLTSGSGISITPAAGSITISSTATATPWIAWNMGQGVAPTSAPAGQSTRNQHRVATFDPSTDEGLVFEGALDDSYNSSNNLTVTLYWAANGATSGAAVWNVAFEYVDDGTLDLDADSFASAQAATTTTAGTDGVLATTTITFTQSQADSIVAGSPFRLKVTRDADNGSDTLTVDAQLVRVTVEQ